MSTKKRKIHDGLAQVTANGHDRSPSNKPAASAAGALSADTPRKKSAASRIGRACDRCQHRKLACDPSPGGCPSCQKNHNWCTVTDPLTGTPTYRGEFEYLERRVEKQQRDIEDLLARLRALGQDVDYEFRQQESTEDRRYKAWTVVKAAGDTRPWDREGGAKSKVPPPPASSPGHRSVSTSGSASGLASAGGAGAERRSFDRKHSGSPSASVEPMGSVTAHGGLADGPLGTLAPEAYVGVAAARGSPVSSRLNMFGWTLDLASFTTPDADDADALPSAENPVYDRSYRSGLATMYGTQPSIEEPKLPPKEEVMQYAAFMVHVLNPYTPVLHKTKYMNMVTQVLNNPNSPTTIAQRVILHMTVANILMHLALRNQEKDRMQMNARATRHYHFSLGHFGDLLLRDSLEDVQALSLICLFTRNFPKPELNWAVTQRLFSRLIELGYHRAPRKVRPEGDELSVYESEMQKRVFWVVLIILTITSGKLGRPMPLRPEDYDVDLPAAIPDEALGEAGIDEQRRHERCGFQPHIELCKICPIYMDVYSTIYTAKRIQQDYRAFVERIDNRLKSWKEGWPKEYRGESGEEPSELDKMSIAFLGFFDCEIRLLLHHPSLSITKAGAPNHEDLRICLRISHDMLKDVREMQRLRALEGTWHNCAMFMLAIQTSLYAHGQLQQEINAAQLEELRLDMTLWLSIMGDMGILIGSGAKLQKAVQQQIQVGTQRLQLAVQSKINLANKLPKIENPLRTDVKVEEAPPSTSSSNQTQSTHMMNGAYNGYTNGGSANYQSSSSSYQDMQQMYQQIPHSSYSYAADPSSSNVPTSYSSTPPLSSPYQPAQASSATYGMSLNAPIHMTPHHRPVSSPSNNYNGHAPPPVSAATSYNSGGYYGGYGSQAATSQGADPTTSWLQYTQMIPTNAAPSPNNSTSSGPVASAGGGGSNGAAADHQPAAASALLQLGNRGGPSGPPGMGAEMPPGMGLPPSGPTSFDAFSGAGAQQWPLTFIGDRGGYGEQHR